MLHIEVAYNPPHKADIHPALGFVFRFFLAFQHLPAGIFNWYIPNQWIVFFERSDWLLKLRIVAAIHLLAFLWILRTCFSSFSQNKGAIWCWLSTGLVHTKTIHLSVREEW